MSKDAKQYQRERLFGLLGELPSHNRNISVHKVFREKRENYVLEKLILDLNGFELVPAYFILPKNITTPLPAILYNHSHGGEYNIGKDELINGKSILRNPPYAEYLAQKGYCVLCIDTWAFGERRNATETAI